jgi:putative transcriptional regulator
VKTGKIGHMAKPRNPDKSSSAPGSTQDDPAFFAHTGSTTSPELNLAHHFLIAMPSMLDPIFGGTVVYLCEHNERGALGVVINRPTDMTVDTLFERIDLALDPLPIASRPVMFGGPVQDDRGFVLHSPIGGYSSTLKVTDEVAFTTSKDVLEAVASGTGPERLLISIGYSGWGPGQLELEITRNGWLTVAADPTIMFDLPIEQRYAAAIRLLGIDPMMLAGEAGHA